MKQILIIEIIGYFGILLLQSIWYIRGKLTEERFALYQVTPLTLIMITSVLYAYLTSPDLFAFTQAAIAAIFFPILGFPMARWIYRQIFRPK